MAAVDIADPQELSDLLQILGVTSVDGLPPVEVPAIGQTTASAHTPLPRQTITREPPSIGTAKTLLVNFRAHLSHLGVDFDTATIVDLLASYLSSQVLLFAGPSGTGKSTAASCLQTFFAPADSRAVVNGRRQLMGPEDVAGYYSPLGQVFVAGPDLASLDHLARPSAAAPCPCLLVEEINLSPPEGYLNPLVHGFSGLSTRRVEWRVFADDLAAEASRQSVLAFEPFLRLLGTINVDATAPAPAPKVAARACVVLLEPLTTNDFSKTFDLLDKNKVVDPGSDGAVFANDPLDVLKSADHRRGEIATSCFQVAAAVEYGEAAFADKWSAVDTPIRQLSKRQAAQILVYTSWFDVLAQAVHAIDGGDPAYPSVGAENAVLHFILPSLNAPQFSTALDLLASSPLSVAATSGLGGTLRSRIDRLAAGDTESGFSGRLLDFWDRLS